MEEGPNGVPYKTVQTVENEQREVYLSTLYRIARRLDIDIRELFDFIDKPLEK
jgi:transcriptional regulator with XRE-family HTH domain